jgi:DNA-binding PadR family transcriptional regulator
MPAYLGEFEQLVLLAVLRLEGGATGAAIRDAVAEGSRRTVWIGAVHTTLDRLELKGLVRSRAVPTPTARGGRRKIFGLQPAGRAAITHAYGTWTRMTEGLRPKLESS